jgi:hypothetical protein
LPATNLVRTGVCLAILLVVVGARAVAAEPQTILLWPDGAPGSERKNAASKIPEEVVRVNENGEPIVSGIHHPSITAYLPAKDKSTGAAIVIAPGGGHRELWMDHEGYNVAKWLSDHGVAAFVLKYRLAREPGSTYTVEGSALPDIKPAIRLVRSRALQGDLIRSASGSWDFPPVANWPRSRQHELTRGQRLPRFLEWLFRTMPARKQISVGAAEKFVEPDL